MKESCYFLLLFFFFMMACHSRSEMGVDHKMAAESLSTEAKEYYEEADADGNNSENQGQNESTILKDRKIIKTANLRCEVEDMKKSAAKIEATLSKYGAYLSNTEYSSSAYSLENSLTIRVPIAQFDPLLAAIGTEALYVDYKNINSHDVTEEYLDIETRLQTKKEVRDRYIDVLRNKAKTVTEILDAEDKIRVIQEEIESKEGRLNYLKNQVSFSTIHLNLYQKLSGYAAQQPGFFKKMGRAFTNGWEIFLNLLLGMVNIWPILLLGGLGIWGLRWFWRRR